MFCPRIVSDSEVIMSLSWPMVNEAVEESLIATSATKNETKTNISSYVHQPIRTITENKDYTQRLLSMPVYVGNYHLSSNPVHNKNEEAPCSSTSNKKMYSTLGCKLTSSFSQNPRRVPPLPLILSSIMICDIQTGALQYVIEGTKITAWRIASASVVATKYLYFARFKEYIQKPVVVAIVGCGDQGRSHAFGMCFMFNVSQIFLWDRTEHRSKQLAEDLMRRNTGCKIEIKKTVQLAVEFADIICMCTSAGKVLINWKMLNKESVHINTVSTTLYFGEIAPDVYKESRIYVDWWVNAKHELKDFRYKIQAEIGEVIRTRNFPPEEGITVFQSMGMAAQDVTVAQAVINKLKADKKI